MEQTARFTVIEQLLPAYHEYRTTGQTRLDKLQTEALNLIYWDLYKVKANTGCPVCCSHYLAMLATWYDREHSLWLSQQPVPEVIQEPLQPEPAKKAKLKTKKP